MRFRRSTRDKKRLLAVEWHGTNLHAGNVEMTIITFYFQLAFQFLKCRVCHPNCIEEKERYD